MDENLNQPTNTEKRREKWYFRWWAVALWLATAGPFAFPALWVSKDISLFWKWFWTIAITGLTIFLCWGTWQTVKLTIDQFKQLTG